MEKVNILWFKKDLRIHDNEALFEASKSFKVLPIYVIENDLWAQNTHSDRQWQFCKESLIDLNQDLKSLGQQLVLRTGDVIEAFEEISKSFEIMGIYRVIFNKICNSVSKSFSFSTSCTCYH